MILFDFTSESECSCWHSIDDAVMGGLSESRFGNAVPGTAVFHGSVSLKNSGGFASVRSRASTYDSRNYDGISVRVRGDGKKYKMHLKTQPDPDGILYQAGVETERDEWTDIRIPFVDVVPVYRGNSVKNAAPLNPASSCTFGFIKYRAGRKVCFAWRFIRSVFFHSRGASS